MTHTPNGWLVRPSTEQVNLLPALEWGGLAMISAVGIAWLVIVWRRAPRPYRLGWRMPIRQPIPY